MIRGVIRRIGGGCYHPCPPGVGAGRAGDAERPDPGGVMDADDLLGRAGENRARRLDLDDIRAHVAEQLSAEGSGEELAHFDDLDPGQRAGVGKRRSGGHSAASLRFHTGWIGAGRPVSARQLARRASMLGP